MTIVFRWAFRGLACLVALAACADAFAQSVPVITTQPSNLTVAVGTPAAFSVAATSPTALSYQWLKNNVAIAGATAASFSIPVTVVADSSVYSVRVTNAAGSVTSNLVTLSVVTPPSVTVGGPGGVAAGQSATFTATASGGRPPYTYQWYRNGLLPANLIPGATGPTYVLANPTVTGDDGTKFYVRITDANQITSTSDFEDLVVFQGTQSIVFTAPPNPVVSPTPITLNGTATSGLPVTYTVTGQASVAGNALTLRAVGSVTVRASQAGNVNYSAAPEVAVTFTVAKGTPAITWATPAPVADGAVLGAAQLNATANVPGSFAYTPASGTLRAPSQLITATFTPTDTANYNTASAQRTVVVTVTPVEVARLSNVSVRTTLAAAQTLVVGFTMQGGSKPVLVRAVGPGLAPLGVTGTMSDPRIVLFKDATALESNDNWGGGGGLAATFASVGAFPVPAGSLDAALVRSIEGGHTAQITGPEGTVLVEVYDAGAGSTPRLTNVSARNRAGTGSSILIAGFTLAGPGERRLLVRGVGPTLAALNVQNTLTDPKLELFAGSTRIAENDTWNPSLAATFSSVGAFALSAGSRDAALTLSLPAGSYTVQVSGADGGTGEAVVEIYELP